jgi:hypothetical protein
MSTKQEGKGTFAAVKMPKTYLDFIKRNDNVARIVGTLMVGLAELKEHEKQVKHILNSPEIFEKELENGTPEELRGFLKKVLEDIDNDLVRVYQDITDTEHQEIVEKLGQFGEVVSTKVELDEPVNS